MPPRCQTCGRHAWLSGHAEGCPGAVWDLVFYLLIMGWGRG